ncbi:unannotated protein [freshwater metagenome]|uniref:Unannotated protein n=1 Tax=freshwater metagenome TaxID=449393 RepID=A0A6J7S0J7_9ZZZZ
MIANRDVLDALVHELLEKETLDRAEIDAVFQALQLQEVRPAWTGSARRQPDTRGPIDHPRPMANGHSELAPVLETPLSADETTTPDEAQ